MVVLCPPFPRIPHFALPQTEELLSCLSLYIQHQVIKIFLGGLEEIGTYTFDNKQSINNTNEYTIKSKLPDGGEPPVPSPEFLIVISYLVYPFRAILCIYEL